MEREAADEREKRRSGSKAAARPIKQARKSNEVARLLNDLTAGNCTDGLESRRLTTKQIIIGAKRDEYVDGLMWKIGGHEAAKAVAISARAAATAHFVPSNKKLMEMHKFYANYGLIKKSKKHKQQTNDNNNLCGEENKFIDKTENGGCR